MKLLHRYIFLVLFFSCLYSSGIQAQTSFINPKEFTRVLFLLDGSQSMQNSWDRSSRIAEAKRILSSIADSISLLQNAEMGLRIYGHQSDQSLVNCHDTRLEAPFTKNNTKIIKKKLETLTPMGITPIALSLQKCANDFPKGECRNVIILITDGTESCGGDPCAIAKDLQSKGIILKPFIIGLGIENSISSDLECIGKYKNVTDSKSFEAELKSILNTVLTRTTVEIDLLDTALKPTETSINMTFYDVQMMNVRYDYYHTINVRGNPDTLLLDPIVKYNLDVHTIPSIEKNDISLVSNSHNTIAMNAAQGALRLTSPNKSGLKCLIKKINFENTLWVQNFNTSEKYLCGNYDLNILTLPRIEMKNIEISQSKTTTIQIPAAGNLSVEKNGEIYGGIFYLKDNSWIKLYEFKFKIYLENIALQPGNYRIIYRNKINKKMKETKIKDVVIKSNQMVAITL
jgi:Ca-activated chloride channel family protein